MLRKIDSLQYLRALAAVLVVINHLWPEGKISSTLGFNHIGGIGVDLFFIISGFIMGHTISEKIVNKKLDSLNFIKKRITRIYPIYLVITIPLLIIYFLKSITSGTEISLYMVVGNILLLPSFTNDPNYKMLIPVAWTLCYEMFFYIIYGISILLSSKKNDVILISSILILFTFAFDNIFGFKGARLHWVNFSYMLGDSLLINFIIGGVLYIIANKTSRVVFKIQHSVIFAILTLIISMTLLSGAGIGRFFTFGIPASIIVFMFIKSDTSKIDMGMNKFLITLGNASYSIYLIHYLFKPLFPILTTTVGISHDIVGILLVLAALLTGTIFYRKIEIPLMRMLTKRKALLSGVV
ncbi:acyltransferase family protein [Sodalis sp. RH20]|uniref:acyltransferase family protein n=1 Tax=unclassified Sodalis (in: enterobacteria) TaxID=2636512 RepID=UPI0039B47CA4